MMAKIRVVLVVAALATGCDTYRFLSGTIHEDAGRPVKAIRQYEAFLAGRPKDPRACEVRLRAAELYRTFFLRCSDAQHHYETAARDFPHMTACADLAKAGLLKCPDYFPLEVGRTWVYVDSDTKGKSMRLDWELRKSSGAAGGVIITALYAGNKRIRESREIYLKENWALWRIDGPQREPLLRYPYGSGQTWKAGGAKGKEWSVVASSVAVTVAAGAFAECLKVKEHDLSYGKSWRYDYYCPGVGRVKTTVGGPGFENPNTELSRFGQAD